MLSRHSAAEPSPSITRLSASPRCYIDSLHELSDVASETTHRSEIEAHLQRTYVPAWDLAFEGADKVAAHGTHVDMRKGRVAVVADAGHDVSGPDRVTDLDLDVLDVHVADLHRCVPRLTEPLKQDGSRGIRAPSPRPIHHRVPEDELYDAVERRMERLIPAEPILVARSVARVEAIEVAERATVAAIDKAVCSKRITRVILRSERVLRAGEGGGQWRIDDNRVDRRIRQSGSPWWLTGASTCDDREQRTKVGEGDWSDHTDVQGRSNA